ncbi:hypothetical protein NDU88_002109 [Pleurodeles waltl]|uniref:Uncharacterized protein n=1 Tax=Pleurodeles waltl TaxID=8319 RepID=A0AAV7UXS4_PLEWA|nr:hypothetical protein NDU88_002109 [Pleurodeles waltl]
MGPFGTAKQCPIRGWKGPIGGTVARRSTRRQRSRLDGDMEERCTAHCIAPDLRCDKEGPGDLPDICPMSTGLDPFRVAYGLLQPWALGRGPRAAAEGTVGDLKPPPRRDGELGVPDCGQRGSRPAVPGGEQQSCTCAGGKRRGLGQRPHAWIQSCGYRARAKRPTTGHGGGARSWGLAWRP